MVVPYPCHEALVTSWWARDTSSPAEEWVDECPLCICVYEPAAATGGDICFGLGVEVQQEFLFSVKSSIRGLGKYGAGHQLASYAIYIWIWGAIMRYVLHVLWYFHMVIYLGFQFEFYHSCVYVYQQRVCVFVSVCERVCVCVCFVHGCLCLFVCSCL